MSSLNSTTVRARNIARSAAFRLTDLVLPRIAGRIAADLWFAAPPRMADLPVPPGGERFEVRVDGRAVVGRVWEATPGGAPATTVYLVHGWGGCGSQFGAMVEPLVAAGHRVVMFDAPGHGHSEHGAAGPRRADGLQLAKALDAVFRRFGPAEAVVAHSMGVLATYLALRFGWLGTQRLVALAPMVESQSLFDQFRAVLGFGERTRRVFDRRVLDLVGIPVTEFDARFQAGQVEPVPTLVVADRGDRQTPYDDVVDLARSIRAPLVTTEGLGHRKILRDPDVVARVVEFVSGRAAGSGTPADLADAAAVPAAI